MDTWSNCARLLHTTDLTRQPLRLCTVVDGRIPKRCHHRTSSRRPPPASLAHGDCRLILAQQHPPRPSAHRTPDIPRVRRSHPHHHPGPSSSASTAAVRRFRSRGTSPPAGRPLVGKSACWCCGSKAKAALRLPLRRRRWAIAVVAGGGLKVRHYAEDHLVADQAMQLVSMAVVMQACRRSTCTHGTFAQRGRRLGSRPTHNKSDSELNFTVLLHLASLAEPPFWRVVFFGDCSESIVRRLLI